MDVLAYMDISCTIGKMTYTFNFGIVEYLPYKMLLGCSTIWNLKVLWTPWEGFCTISNEKIKIFTLQKVEKSAQTAIVYLINDVLIPVGYITVLIPVGYITSKSD